MTGGVSGTPVKLMIRGEINRDVWDMVLANVRTPDERDGDLAAMLAANRTGERRLLEIVGINRRGAAQDRFNMVERRCGHGLAGA